MSPFQIQVLDPIKLPLVSRLYKSYYPSGKAKKDELTIVGSVDGKIVSVVRFKAIEECRLLTGMLVVPDFRGKGLGHKLMEYCESHVLQAQDFCFAYSNLEAFYRQHGFVKLEANVLPNTLKILYERYSLNKSLVAMQYVPMSN
ncbi:GNAT family N-acetyltransferase [Vibrio pectenicida]|uniref:GNAT family N-acetyltransferase n=1 Tax=Vibrio pectenicida TaxID=62763 RepID=A0A7Y4ECK8_9VIBR|nr:GNAT family N-acetyltransferase [Vibrio pectenicida]NOH70745.1 GNAT family N-acetyltransferase [Vibrio pectenicida]